LRSAEALAVAQFVKARRAGALEYSSSSRPPPPIRRRCRHRAVQRLHHGEYFRDNACMRVIIYDDLSKQAVPIARCRCCCAAAGPRSHPGDVSICIPLLRAAAKLNDDHGAGSLTALPIIETQATTCRPIFRPT